VKKVAAVFLCFLFLFNILGYYSAFLIQRAQLKKEMKAFIKSDAGSESLQKLIIPADKYELSINFIEENEFIYQGVLYDLVKKEEAAADIILYCINDKKEQLLMDSAKVNYSKNLDQNSSSNKTTSVLKHIIKEACPEILSGNFYLLFSSLNYREDHSSLLSVYIKFPSLPPNYL
jgi:hypothetical protein